MSELSTYDLFPPTSNGAICDESVRDNLAGLLPKVGLRERDHLTVAGCRIALRMYSYDLNRCGRTNLRISLARNSLMQGELTQRSDLQLPKDHLRGNY